MGELVDPTGDEVVEMWVGSGPEGRVGGSREEPLEEPLEGPDETPRRGDCHWWIWHWERLEFLKRALGHEGCHCGGGRQELEDEGEARRRRTC